MLNHKMGVLFTDILNSEWYHVMLGKQVVRDVLHTTRERDKVNDIYHTLYTWMINTQTLSLWVHPDTQLSVWVDREDFKHVQRLNCFVPRGEESIHPYGVRLSTYKGSKFVFFPAYGHYVREHRNTDGWLIPSPDHLYNTVNYVERVTDLPLLWTPGASSLVMLRDCNKGYEYEPFVDSAGLWPEISLKMVNRPSWVYHTRDGKRGLKPEWCKGEWYIHKLDKNGQYLGACVNNYMGQGGYYVVNDSSIPLNDKVYGFWEYELLDVSDSPFNGYELPCPLSKKYNWASSKLLVACDKVGIKFRIKRGIMWDSASRPMQNWALRLWDCKQELRDEKKYPDTLARGNASGTIKKYYLDMIGRLCEEYSKEYYHPDWNRNIVNWAIASQVFSLNAREQSRKNTVMVNNDAIYVISQYDDPRCDYASFLTRSDKLAGFKYEGTARVTDEIITAFREEKSVYMVEAIVKKGFNNATTTTR